MMQETYMVEEDPQELPPVVSVETSDDGTTRRTETTVRTRTKFVRLKQNLKIEKNKNGHQSGKVFLISFAV